MFKSDPSANEIVGECKIRSGNPPKAFHSFNLRTLIPKARKTSRHYLWNYEGHGKQEGRRERNLLSKLADDLDTC